MVDLSKFAVKGGTTTKKEKTYNLSNPDAPASFSQKKFLSVIFRNQGMVLDWNAPMTMREASELITAGKDSLPPVNRKKRGW